jgi:TRAP-type C4-dicarboxylate transport system permease small subunit
MLLAVIDIAGAKLFDHGILSALDYISYLNVVLVFMSIGYVTLERGHMTINILEGHMSNRVEHILKLAGNFIAILFCIFWCWRSVIEAQILLDNMVRNHGSVPFLVWPFAIVMIWGCILLTLGFIIVFVKGIRAMPAKSSVSFP